MMSVNNMIVEMNIIIIITWHLIMPPSTLVQSSLPLAPGTEVMVEEEVGVLLEKCHPAMTQQCATTTVLRPQLPPISTMPLIDKVFAVKPVFGPKGQQVTVGEPQAELDQVAAQLTVNQ